MKHGLATSFRRCTDGPNGSACPECVIAGREAANARQKKSRDAKKGVTEVPVPRPRLTLVTSKTAGQNVETASHSDPVPAREESHPRAGRETPSVDPGAGRTAYEDLDMPYLWPTALMEPDYAEEHRSFLAGIVANVLADTENYIAPINFEKGTAKREKKDFDKLVKEFIKANPDTIVYEWMSTCYIICSPYYSGDPTEDDFTKDTAKQEDTLKDEPIQYVPTEDSKPQKVIPNNTGYRPLAYFMPRARGICTVSIDRNPWCDNIADGRFFWEGHPVCKECFDTLKPYYPGACTQKKLPKAQ